MITKQKNACKQVSSPGVDNITQTQTAKEKKFLTRGVFQIFKECKEAEDKSVNLIYNCMNEHSLKYINQVFLLILPKSFQYTLCE